MAERLFLKRAMKNLTLFQAAEKRKMLKLVYADCCSDCETIYKKFEISEIIVNQVN